jgi:hypothetical protein
MTSGDKIGFFFEDGSRDEKGNQHIAINIPLTVLMPILPSVIFANSELPEQQFRQRLFKTAAEQGLFKTNNDHACSQNCVPVFAFLCSLRYLSISPFEEDIARDLFYF